MAALIAGCGGGSGGGTPNIKGTVGGLPVPPAPAQANDYTGTATPGDLWTMHIDHTSNSFTARDTTSAAAAISGTIGAAAGFLTFSVNNAASGYAREILGRGVLARLGDDTNDLIVLAQTPSGTCLSITGNVGFSFVTVPASSWSVATDTAFGSLSASTSGSTWNFSRLTQATLSGSPTNAGATLAPGSCSNSLITVPPSATVPVTTTVAIGPSGIFVADKGSGIMGQAGVIQPSFPLNTANVVAAGYLGFWSEPGAAVRTQIVAFGGGSGTSMPGGAFPNDDPTQPHATNMTIDLGAQDAATNGLYRAASVTIGANPPFPAVAVVGNPENKFVIFLIAQDVVSSHPMALYLFQQ